MFDPMKVARYEEGCAVREKLWLLADRMKAAQADVREMLRAHDGSIAADTIIFSAQALEKFVTALQSRIAELDRRLHAHLLSMQPDA